MCQRLILLAAAGFLGLSLLTPAPASAQVGAIINALNQINDGLAAQVVPFKVVDDIGGLCDSAGNGTSNPEIYIDSDGEEGEFVVTSILIRTAPSLPLTGFRDLNLNAVGIDGDEFDTATANLLDPTIGSGVAESADLMGTPVMRNADPGNPLPGGNFPHQIVAESEGVDDIRIEFFCSSTDDDLTIDRILVAGWKRPADTITLTYVPGN